MWPDPTLSPFDRAAIPAEKAALWFMAPDKPEDEYASGQDETSFPSVI